MMKIPLHGKLGEGLYAFVDDEDYDLISSLRWFATGRRQGQYYARHDKRAGKFLIVVQMHRLLMGNPKEYQVDHVDGNPLNNQKANLRLSSLPQNIRNRQKLSSNTSGYKGVVYRPGWNKWRARISIDGHRIHLGDFETREAAARAYNDAALTHHAEFACLNELAA